MYEEHEEGFWRDHLGPSVYTGTFERAIRMGATTPEAIWHAKLTDAKASMGNIMGFVKVPTNKPSSA